LRKKTRAFVLLAMVWSLALLVALVSMAALGAPIQVYVFFLIFSGGVLLFFFVDDVVSFKFPSRSIFNHDFDSWTRRTLKSVSFGMYMIGLTILGLILVLPPVTEEGRALLDLVYLYGGTVGGILFLGGLGFAVHSWRQRSTGLPAIIGFGGGTFTPNQIKDLRNGICPRCGSLMRPARSWLGDTSERWFCPECAELFVVRA
jgi:hypothetical protein